MWSTGRGESSVASFTDIAQERDHEHSAVSRPRLSCRVAPLDLPEHAASAPATLASKFRRALFAIRQASSISLPSPHAMLALVSPRTPENSVSRQWHDSVRHDVLSRRAIIDEMSLAQQYSDDEERAIASALELLDAWVHTGGEREVKRSHATMGRERTKVNSEGHVVGASEAIVRGCAPEEAVAFLMDFNSKFTTDPSNLDPKVWIRWETTEVKNAHHRVTYCETCLPPFTNRAWLNSVSPPS